MNQRGDTIIEVLFAFTVFSVVAVGGMTLMNQGAAMTQRTLEISQVRDQMDTQAEALRYMHANYIQNIGNDSAEPVKLWQRIKDEFAVSSVRGLGEDASGENCAAPTPGNGLSGSQGYPFILNTEANRLDGANGGPFIAFTNPSSFPFATTYSQVRDPGGPEGIWIKAVRSPTTGARPGYYDFHIRACWQTPGQSVPVTLGTIVRLYEPAV